MSPFEPEDDLRLLILPYSAQGPLPDEIVKALEDEWTNELKGVGSYVFN